jgi:hypothetical protein
MDQSQHTGADARGEGAAYEFGQQLDSWEKEREWQIPVSSRSKRSSLDPLTPSHHSRHLLLIVYSAVFTRGEQSARAMKAWTDSRTKPLPGGPR